MRLIIDRQTALFYCLVFGILCGIVMIVRAGGETVFHPDIREIELTIDSALIAEDRPTFLTIFCHFTNNSKYKIEVGNLSDFSRLNIRGNMVNPVKVDKRNWNIKTGPNTDLFERVVFDVGKLPVFEGSFVLEIDGAAVGAEKGKFQVRMELGPEVNKRAGYADL